MYISPTDSRPDRQLLLEIRAVEGALTRIADSLVALVAIARAVERDAGRSPIADALRDLSHRGFVDAEIDGLDQSGLSVRARKTIRLAMRDRGMRRLSDLTLELHMLIPGCGVTTAHEVVNWARTVRAGAKG